MLFVGGSPLTAELACESIRGLTPAQFGQIIDQLNRYLYAGVGAVLSLGTDPGTLPFQIRADQAGGHEGGARYLTAGRGIAPRAVDAETLR